MDDTPRLLLVDGHAVAYRAFYAIRELTTKDGLATNALFGFIRMLEQLRKQWTPTHEWVIFDGGLPAERMALLPEYKAQREEMPEPLRLQFSMIQEYLDLAGVPSMTLLAEEADDVMATMTVAAQGAGAEVLLATHDKDMFQLVGNQVAIIPPTKSELRMGIAEIEEKTGVPPALIAEWLALIGDTADNIPGIPGVGPKTAAKWLNAYGSLDGLYAQLQDIKNEKTRATLVEHRNQVYRNVQMTRLRIDLPLPSAWSDGIKKSARVRDLHDFFLRMEFKSMAKALEAPTLFDM